MSFFTFTSKNEVGLDEWHILEIDFKNSSGIGSENGLGKASGNALGEALDKTLGKACPKSSPSWMLIG